MTEPTPAGTGGSHLTTIIRIRAAVTKAHHLITAEPQINTTKTAHHHSAVQRHLHTPFTIQHSRNVGEVERGPARTVQRTQAPSRPQYPSTSADSKGPATASQPQAPSQSRQKTIKTPRNLDPTKTSTSGPKPAKSTENVIEEFASIALTPDEIMTLTTLREKWAARPNVWKEVCSTQWQATQERMLPLLVLPAWEMGEEFEMRRDLAGWSETTASQYWAALRAAATTLQIQLPIEVRIRGKVLGFLAKEADSKRPTVAAREEEIEAASQILKAKRESTLSTALRTAFLLGQRVGDVLQLERSRVAEMQDMASHQATNLLTLQFRKGKTTRRRDPYTLHIPRSNPLTTELLQLAHPTSAIASPALFTPQAHRLQALVTIRTALQQVNPKLCILSVRRGGLQQLASLGVSTETLLAHSRHTTTAMLDRYLNWGSFNLNPVRDVLAHAAVHSAPTNPTVYIAPTNGQSSGPSMSNPSLI